MQTISDTQKQVFKSAARTAMNLIHSGDSPEDAVIKVARQEELTPGFTRRLCEVVNVRQTYGQFQKDAGLEARLESVPVVNADSVVEQLFEEEPEAKRAELLPPPDFNSREEIERMEKAALLEDKAPESSPEFNWKEASDRLMALHRDLEKIQGTISNRMLDVPHALGKAAAALDASEEDFAHVEERVLAKRGARYRDLMDMLAEKCGAQKRAKMDKDASYTYIVDHSSTPYTVVHAFLDAANRVEKESQKKAVLEQKFAHIADQLFTHADDERERGLKAWLRVHGYEKVAEGNIAQQCHERALSSTLGEETTKEAQNFLSPSEQTREKALTSLLGQAWQKELRDQTKKLSPEEIIELAEKETKALEKTKEQREKQKKQREKSRERLATEWEKLPETGRALGKPVKAPIQATHELLSSPENTMLGKILGAGTRAGSEAYSSTESTPSVFTPEHRTEIQKIKTQALLNQFLTSDPILRDANPENVIDAFNEIRSLRPDLVEQPHLLRGLLRYLVQQHDTLEPAMVSQLIEKTTPMPGASGEPYE